MSNNNQQNSTNINWYPGHMAKTKKQIIEDMKLIDIVIEVLDARIPVSSQNPDIKNIIGNKKKIVVLNKCDLSDEKQNQKWVNYYEKEGIKAILTDSNSGKGIAEVIKQIEILAKNDLNMQAKKGRIGKAIRCLVLGIPNVGKSSFINRISNKTSAQVGNKPGVTRQKQWIRVSNNIELLDTPGVLWPKFDNQDIALNLSYIGTIKDDILDKTELSFYLLKRLLKDYATSVMDRYKLNKEDLEKVKSNAVDENDYILQVMNMIGKKRGAIVSGGNVDEGKTANIILEDFRTGKLGRITLDSIR